MNYPLAAYILSVGIQLVLKGIAFTTVGNWELATEFALFVTFVGVASIGLIVIKYDEVRKILLVLALSSAVATLWSFLFKLFGFSPEWLVVIGVILSVLTYKQVKQRI